MAKNIGCNEFKIGQRVYHREVYAHTEPLRIVGIKESELELEGDYSGGVNNVCQKHWLPIEGVSRIYNHAYKKDCREKAIVIQELAKPIGEPKDNITKTMLELLHMVMVLTTDVEYNPEYSTKK